jgi:hypothetical protein
MKKISLFIAIAILGFTASSFSQTDFKLEKTDSVAKTKSQIYSDTKLFISEYWKSAKDVIQNDDKEGGTILVKGSSKQSVSIGMGSSNTFWYQYNVKFLMKEGKYKIIVENVKYERGPSPMWDSYAKYFEPHEQDTFPGLMKAGMNEKRWNELITSLKTEMKNIVDNYEKQIKKTNTATSDWETVK